MGRLSSTFGVLDSSGANQNERMKLAPIDISGISKEPKAPSDPNSGSRKIDLQEPEIDNSVDDNIELKTEAIPKLSPSEESLQGIQQQLSQNAEDAAKRRLAFGAANFVIDVMNANSEYDAVSFQANLNIFQADQSVAAAMSQGASRKVQRESEGIQAGKSSLADLAAQGIDVNSSGAERIQASQEAVGIYNGMMEEINASREALGFEQEIVQLEFSQKQAKRKRDQSFLTAGLKFGARAF